MSNVDYNLVQNAVYAKLVADVPLMAVLAVDLPEYSGVYRGDVPEDAPYPYVYYFRITAPQQRTHSTKRERVLFQFEYYAKAAGDETALEIASKVAKLVKDTLDLQELSLSGFICLEFDSDLGEELDRETRIARTMDQFAVTVSVAK